jgi:hypothetical protein
MIEDMGWVVARGKGKQPPGKNTNQKEGYTAAGGVVFK